MPTAGPGLSGLRPASLSPIPGVTQTSLSPIPGLGLNLNSAASSNLNALPLPLPPGLQTEIGTMTTESSAPPPQRRKRTRAATSTTTGRKRARKEIGSGPPSTSSSGLGAGSQIVVHGVGPSPLSPIEPLQDSTSRIPYRSIIRKAERHRIQIATDVWFFVRALKSRDVCTLPEVEPTFRVRPRESEFGFLGCKLCPSPSWKVWKNGTGQTETIREHLLKSHREQYFRDVKEHQLKGWESLDLPMIPT
ncbi:hypothetical protein B0H21DRAFT_821976 [Amylocystis lapponica]|nr:hypothetical protein B0H21DRAFT_821973 [Amylocystis lapponica]KAH9947393.1 hypothetical protein B0H21DRAFT_821976 [Amylocystis lapponica]